MKWLKHYMALDLTTEDQVFEYLISTLRPSVADWNYLVDWDRVFQNTRDLELQLNKLNYLLGKNDFDKEFRYLVKEESSVLQAFPALLVRTSGVTGHYNILTVEGTELTDRVFDFSKSEPSDKDISDYVEFIQKSGLIKIFAKDGVKNLVDYVLGVEAGLNSNARKNRGGKSMESVCEALLKNLGYEYIAQASQDQINTRFGTNLTGGEGRKYDFAVMANNGLNIIEVNCYGGGGSKLDKTASDFRGLQNDLRGQATFIWITDGFGWQKTQVPLRKTFDSNDHVLNLIMVKSGALDEILSTEL